MAKEIVGRKMMGWETARGIGMAREMMMFVKLFEKDKDN